MLNEHKFEQAREEVTVLSEQLALLVEDRKPGHNFGLKKAQHMSDLASQADQLSLLVGLESDQRLLLEFVLRTHDLGRYIEGLGLGNPRLGTRRHGYESVWLLNRLDALSLIPDQDRAKMSPLDMRPWLHPVMRLFSVDERQAVNFAVYWHSERTVPMVTPLDPQPRQLGYKLCYLLRDLDKEDLLVSPNYFYPPGILQQLMIHYLSPEEQALLTTCPDLKAQALRTIGQLLEPFDLPDKNKLANPLDQKITGILNGPVSETALAQFSQHQSLDLSELKYSWSNYLLVQLAMIFDLKVPAIIDKVHRQPEVYIKPRLEFIRLKAGPEVADKISAALATHNGAPELG